MRASARPSAPGWVTGSPKAGQSLTLLDMREFNGKIFNALGAVDRNQAAPDFFAP